MSVELTIESSATGTGRERGRSELPIVLQADGDHPPALRDGESNLLAGLLRKTRPTGSAASLVRLTGPVFRQLFSATAGVPADRPRRCC